MRWPCLFKPFSDTALLEAVNSPSPANFYVSGGGFTPSSAASSIGCGHPRFL